MSRELDNQTQVVREQLERKGYNFGVRNDAPSQSRYDLARKISAKIIEIEGRRVFLTPEEKTARESSEDKKKFDAQLFEWTVLGTETTLQALEEMGISLAYTFTEGVYQREAIERSAASSAKGEGT
jgi:hypothetical protein